MLINDKKYITYYDDDRHPSYLIFKMGGKNHKEMSEQMGLKREDIVGAGFWGEQNGKIFCFGKSESLGISSIDDDTAWIEYL